MKKLFITPVCAIFFLMAMGCSPGNIKKESFVNEDYLARLTEQWIKEIEQENPAYFAEPYYRFYGENSAEEQAELYKMKEELNIQAPPGIFFELRMKELPKNKLFSHVFTVVKRE